MKLHDLKPAMGSTHARKRVGRGNGSGHGTFSGKGCKGQGARSGGTKPIWFEGGQTPLLARLPKLKGFKNINHVEYVTVNLDDLENNFESGEKVDLVALRECGLVKRNCPVKVLGRGTLTKKLEVVCEASSASAKEAIEKAGGVLTLTAKASE